MKVTQDFIWSSYMDILEEDGTNETNLEHAQQNLRIVRTERVDPAVLLGADKEIGYKCKACFKYETSFTMHASRSADEGMVTHVTCFACGHSWVDNS